MEKFNWTTVAEIIVAGVIVGLILCIVSGPAHRIAAKMHGHCPDGKDHNPHQDKEQFEGNF